MFTVTTRLRGEVRRVRLPTLEAALDAVTVEVLARQDARSASAQAFLREVTPDRQVLVRVEVAGPGARGVRGGVDLRGDGSAEAYTGRWMRRPVSRQGGETAVDALRRALGG